jgi:hypothetical protein
MDSGIISGHAVPLSGRGIVTDLLRFRSANGDVIVEVADDEPGFDRVVGSGLITDARKSFEASLREVHEAMATALRTFRDGGLRPDGVAIEFGVRLNAEAGAVIAKTAIEGHLTVKLSWRSPGAPDEESAAQGT